MERDSPTIELECHFPKGQKTTSETILCRVSDDTTFREILQLLLGERLEDVDPHILDAIKCQLYEAPAGRVERPRVGCRLLPVALPYSRRDKNGNITDHRHHYADSWTWLQSSELCLSRSTRQLEIQPLRKFPDLSLLVITSLVRPRCTSHEGLQLASTILITLEVKILESLILYCTQMSGERVAALAITQTDAKFAIAGEEEPSLALGQGTCALQRAKRGRRVLLGRPTSDRIPPGSITLDVQRALANKLGHPPWFRIRLIMGGGLLETDKCLEQMLRLGSDIGVDSGPPQGKALQSTQLGHEEAPLTTVQATRPDSVDTHQSYGRPARSGIRRVDTQFT